MKELEEIEDAWNLSLSKKEKKEKDYFVKSNNPIIEIIKDSPFVKKK